MNSAKRRTLSISADSTVDTLPQMRHVEVNKQADSVSTEAQVREQLSFMHWKDVFNGLDLNDDCVLDEKINAIAKRDADAVINDRK